ncbi:MAG: restriction endonuclease subunit S [Desulfobacterales bacterium]|nr:restriction endonuclease subunit S [Desulfobacterales bacterium]
MIEELKKTSMPANWLWTELKELTEDPKNDIVDGPFGSNLKASEYVESGIPVFKIQNIKANRFLDKNICYITPQKAEELERHTFQKNDLIITKLGNPLGLCCKVPRKYHYGVIVADLMRFKPSPQRVYDKYLIYGINSILVQSQFKAITKGTTRPRVNLTIVRGINFPLAPLPEQRAIVAKIEQLFSELDNGIVNLKTAKDKLAIYRQAVLKKAFEGELSKEWRKNNPYSEKSLGLLIDYINDFNEKKEGQDIPRRLPPIDLTDLPEVPFGWIWSEAHKICQSVRDGTHDTPKYVSKGVPLVTSKNLKSGEVDLIQVDLISKEDHDEICKRSAVEKNDILYGMIGTIGNPVIVSETNIFSIKNVGLFKKNEKLIFPKYLRFYLSSWLVEHIMRQKELIRGTTQKFVALGGLRVLPVPLPSIQEQAQIVKEIETRLSVCDNAIKNIDEGLKKSEALRQSILKKAFEGKLLSNAELQACRKESDWEPARKLLERIKKARLEQSRKEKK